MVRPARSVGECSIVMAKDLGDGVVNFSAELLYAVFQS